MQKLKDEINKSYEDLNVNIGLDGEYFDNKYREISLLTNKLNNLKKYS